MSESDIYKKREPMPVGKAGRPAPRRRRRKRERAFDDKQRKRRSRNSGFRRLLHLTRKQENEKFFWWSMGTCFVVLVVLVALWQFVIQEAAIREQSRESELHRPVPEHRIPEDPARSSAK